MAPQWDNGTPQKVGIVGPVCLSLFACVRLDGCTAEDSIGGDSPRDRDTDADTGIGPDLSACVIGDLGLEGIDAAGAVRGSCNSDSLCASSLSLSLSLLPAFFW